MEKQDGKEERQEVEEEEIRWSRRNMIEEGKEENYKEEKGETT